MRIAFLTQGRTISSSRFRVQQYLPLLRERGLVCWHLPRFPRQHYAQRGGRIRTVTNAALAVPSRVLGVLASAACDVVFLQREVLRGLAPWPEHLISQIGSSLIFDFDDAIWLRYPSTGADNPIARIIRSSRAVIAGNEYLADYASSYNSNVFILPTPVDTTRIAPTPSHTADDLFRVGWTGSASTLGHLYELVPVFEKLSSLSDRIVLSIICDRPPDRALGLPVEFLRWSPEVEVAGLHAFDVGIMPLPDNAWTRGKCSYKLLQYLAAGIPAVGAPVGMNAEVLGDIMDRGFLPRTTHDWIEALELLYRESGLRQDLGAAGREYAEKRYDLHSHAETLMDIISRSS